MLWEKVFENFHIFFTFARCFKNIYQHLEIFKCIALWVPKNIYQVGWLNYEENWFLTKF